MSHTNFRSSAGDLGFHDEPLRRGPERWDREKFERFSRRGGPAEERESFRFEEHDHSGPGRSRRDVEVDERIDRRGPRTRVEERERFFEEDRVERPRRRPSEFLDEPTASEVANRALAPYRRKSIIEKDIDPPSRRPARPQYIRRQSSLDTFDRKPFTRYGDQERDGWRPPTNVPIPLPIRRSPSRRRSLSRRRYREDDFEEIRYRDVEPREEYREVEVRREKSTRRRSLSRTSRRGAPSARSSTSSFEEVSLAREPSGKKGKTRMPKRLVRKQAVIELGYPFEEEDDFIIVRRALVKEQIDEIIKISETYKDNERTTYVYEETKTNTIEPRPPPPPEVIRIPPPPPSVHYAPPQSVRSASPSRHEVYEERIEESNHIGGPLTVLVPEERRHRDERDIKSEIRRLEAERQLLKYERESDRFSEYEIVERRDKERDVVRIEKDRKAKTPNPKLIAAMMATLT
ncbi:uncharacterized protein K441DRAFT_596277 [Cenococcum geophilum 1.58]|uniref:Uncharacterized protein n=1 Tax=Cenococcum geophilum 1.58 TaxID=794803 RepID=A0ACC8EL98_9PEZI|nr:hypothetical protein K441DRAFT_596277 [Cenococcum geophilum 1.58]